MVKLLWTQIYGHRQLILTIQTDDFFEDIKGDLKEWFDISGYDRNMVLSEEFAKNASINKKVIGKMKDELAKGHMSELLLQLLRYMYINKSILINHYQKIKKLG